MGHRFRNWSRTVEFQSDSFRRPKDEAQVRKLVDGARRDRQVVRTQGAGHSFSQIITTPDLLLSLDKMSGVVSRKGNEVTVRGGTRLKDLIPDLKAIGLGLPNMGSVTEQSIAGAISTATHGTGLGLGTMSTNVTAMRLVTGNGTIEDIRGSTNPLALHAGRVSLGALGVITEVTLACVDYYEVDYDVYVCDFDQAVRDLPTLARENERVLLWWFLMKLLPPDKVIVITKNKAPAAPTGLLARASDLTADFRRPGPWYWPFKRDYTGTPHPAELAKSLRSLAGAKGAYTRVLHRSGGYEDMLTIPLLPVYHRECEYAVPVEHTTDALEALRTVFNETDATLRLPVEVRFVKGDQDMLSPANNRDVCFIGASTLDNATEIFERFEPLMKEFGGRPHWGKHFNLTRSEVTAMYPRHGDFVAERRARDPDGVFLNTLLRRLFA
jgi:FAD/FMN-containing dehydrogenase